MRRTSVPRRKGFAKVKEKVGSRQIAVGSRSRKRGVRKTREGSAYCRLKPLSTHLVVQCGAIENGIHQHLIGTIPERAERHPFGKANNAASAQRGDPYHRGVLQFFVIGPGNISADEWGTSI